MYTSPEWYNEFSGRKRKKLLRYLDSQTIYSEDLIANVLAEFPTFGIEFQEARELLDWWFYGNGKIRYKNGELLLLHKSPSMLKLVRAA